MVLATLCGLGNLECGLGNFVKVFQGKDDAHDFREQKRFKEKEMMSNFYIPCNNKFLRLMFIHKCCFVLF